MVEAVSVNNTCKKIKSHINTIRRNRRGFSLLNSIRLSITKNTRLDIFPDQNWCEAFYDVSCRGEICLISKLWAVRLKVLFVKTFETTETTESTGQMILSGQTPVISPLSLHSRLSQPSLYRAPVKILNGHFLGHWWSLVEPAVLQQRVTVRHCNAWLQHELLQRNWQGWSLACNCFIASHQSSLFIISNVGFLYKDVFVFLIIKTGSQLHRNWLVSWCGGGGGGGFQG